MRSIATIARNAVVIGVLGIAAATVAGPSFTSWAQDSDGGCCDSTPSDPGGGLSVPGVNLGPSEGGAGGGRGPGEIAVKPPPEPKIGNRPVIIKRPDIPEVPPPVVEPRPSYEPAPVDNPVPVAVEQLPAPVALPPAPAPVQIQPLPAAPAVPEPVSRVLLTSSMQPATQAITIILLISVIGVWMYANQIITQWSLGRKALSRAST